MEKFDHLRESRAELISHFFTLAKGIECLGGKSVSEVFSNEENIRDLIDRLSEKQFIELLNGLNGMIRGVRKSDWGMSRQEMQISGQMESETVFTPELKDRANLFSKLFHAVTEMNGNGRSLEDMALLVSTTVNAIHPYENANGRTSRLIFSLLAEGYTAETRNRVSVLLSEEGSDHLTTDYRYITGALNNIIRSEYACDFSNLFSDIPTSQFIFQDGVTNTQKKQIVIAFMACATNDLAFAVFDLLKKRKDKDRYYRKYPDNRKVVMFDALASVLSGTEIEEILEKLSNIRARRVELLIDCINHPDKKEFQVKTKDGEAMSVLEKLRRGVRRSL